MYFGGEHNSAVNRRQEYGTEKGDGRTTEQSPRETEGEERC